jgi:hypothetical protein
MCNKSDDELVNISRESIFNGLQGGKEERNKVPLRVVINFDRNDYLEGCKRDIAHGRNA